MTTTHEHDSHSGHDHGHGPIAHLRNFMHEQPFVTDYHWRVPTSFRHLSLVGIVVLVVAMLLTHLGVMNALGLGIGAAVVLHIPIVGVTIAGWILRRARTGFITSTVNLIDWKGQEEVLDVGCGSGILLFACLKKSPSANGTGIDIYDPYSFGGSAGVFWKNAEIEGLKGRVTLQQVDARTMPFEAARFDVIVSSLAMHHVGNGDEQAKATREMIRTLKPSGKIAICDVSRALDAPEGVLRAAGFTVHRSGHLFQILSAEKR